MVPGPSNVSTRPSIHFNCLCANCRWCISIKLAQPPDAPAPALAPARLSNLLSHPSSCAPPVLAADGALTSTGLAQQPQLSGADVGAMRSPHNEQPGGKHKKYSSMDMALNGKRSIVEMPLNGKRSSMDMVMSGNV